MRSTFATCLLLLIFFGATYAQENDPCSGESDNGWIWADAKTTAVNNWALLDDNVKMKSFKQAEVPLNWLLENTPCLNVALYIRGEDTYKGLEKREKDKAKKTVYQDKLLNLYYTRIKYFGREKYVMDKIGISMYPYYVNRGGKTLSEKRPYWTRMYNTYDSILSISTKENIKYYNVRYYMLSADKMLKLNKDTAAFINAYERCTELINYNLKSNDSKDKWESTKAAVESVIGPIIDCNFVMQKWVPEIKKSPQADISKVKKAITIMVNQKCTDNPDFLDLVEIAYKSEPTPGMAMLLAKKYVSEGNEEKAEFYFKEAHRLAQGADGNEEDPALQAEALMKLAALKAKQGKYSEARKLYLDAIKVDNSVASKAYTNIGDLYILTASSCLPPPEERDPVSNKGPYLAAYDMYSKAGNNAKMSVAKGGFPTKTDIFMRPKYKIGEPIKVYGWIGGTAILRTQ